MVAVGDVPTVDPQGSAACAALKAALPATVGDHLARRKVRPDSPLVAAWGKPAAVLRCGVGVPVTYRPGVELNVVDGVGWFEDDRADDVVYTTVLRQPRVALAVPRTQSSSFEVLVDLSTPVGSHTTGTDGGGS